MTKTRTSSRECGSRIEATIRCDLPLGHEGEHGATLQKTIRVKSPKETFAVYVAVSRQKPYILWVRDEPSLGRALFLARDSADGAPYRAVVAYFVGKEIPATMKSEKDLPSGTALIACLKGGLYE